MMRGMRKRVARNVIQQRRQLLLRHGAVVRDIVHVEHEMDLIVRASSVTHNTQTPCSVRAIASRRDHSTNLPAHRGQTHDELVEIDVAAFVRVELRKQPLS